VQAQTDLQRYELLSGSGQQQGDRAKLGALIRVKAGGLKIDLERLGRDLDVLAQRSADQPEVTRKQITSFRDDLGKQTSELQDLQQRLRSRPVSPPPTRASNSKAGDRPFVRLAGEAEMASPQTLTNKQQLDQQRQFMRDLERPLTDLEGTVNNLQNVSSTIRGEISSQNRMLDGTHEATDRVANRLGRTRTMLDRVSQQDKTKCLLCTVVLLLVALILICIYVVSP